MAWALTRSTRSCFGRHFGTGLWGRRVDRCFGDHLTNGPQAVISVGLGRKTRELFCHSTCLTLLASPPPCTCSGTGTHAYQPEYQVLFSRPASILPKNLTFPGKAQEKCSRRQEGGNGSWHLCCLSEGLSQTPNTEK